MKRVRFLALGILILVALAPTGCGPQVAQHVEESRAAVEAARAAGAPSRAPEEFQAAEGSLKQSQQLLATGSAESLIEADYRAALAAAMAKVGPGVREAFDGSRTSPGGGAGGETGSGAGSGRDGEPAAPGAVGRGNGAGGPGAGGTGRGPGGGDQAAGRGSQPAGIPVGQLHPIRREEGGHASEDRRPPGDLRKRRPGGAHLRGQPGHHRAEPQAEHGPGPDDPQTLSNDQCPMANDQPG